MNISFSIEQFSREDQYRIFCYLRTKFQISEEEITLINIRINDIEGFPARLKFVLRRNGIDNILDLLKLNSQEVNDLSGPKSRELIISFCEAYRFTKLTTKK